MRARGKESSPGRVEGSSRAMLATARPSCCSFATCDVQPIGTRVKIDFTGICSRRTAAHWSEHGRPSASFTRPTSTCLSPWTSSLKWYSHPLLALISGLHISQQAAWHSLLGCVKGHGPPQAQARSQIKIWGVVHPSPPFPFLVFPSLPLPFPSFL